MFVCVCVCVCVLCVCVRARGAAHERYLQQLQPATPHVQTYAPHEVLYARLFFVVAARVTPNWCHDVGLETRCAHAPDHTTRKGRATTTDGAATQHNALQQQGRPGISGRLTNGRRNNAMQQQGQWAINNERPFVQERRNGGDSDDDDDDDDETQNVGTLQKGRQPTHESPSF